MDALVLKPKPISDTVYNSGSAVGKPLGLRILLN
jgi:hypothetical protein